MLTQRLTRRSLVAMGALVTPAIASTFAGPPARARISAQPGAALPETTIWPADLAYEDARRTFNRRLSQFPAAIAYCTTPDDVGGCVLWARQNGVPVSIRAGGHGYEGYAVLDDALVIDVSSMNQVDVDVERGTATVGAGARLIDLYRQLWDVGMTIPSGTCPGVGIAGLTLGGDIGFLSRQFGLTCDNLLAADLVLANGTIARASHDEQPDLFWALRGGGGGNFGVVTSLTFLLTPIAEVTSVTISWPWDDAAPVLDAWQRTAPFVDDRSTLGLTIGPPSDGSITMYGLMNAPAELLWPLLEPLLAVGSPATPHVATTPYIFAAEQLAGPGASQATFKNASAFANEPLNLEAIATLMDWLRAAPSPANLVGFFPLGGAIGRVSPRATAFPHRAALFDLQYQAYWYDPAEADADLTWLRGIRDAMSPFTKGAYVNYIDADLDDWAETYHGLNLSRLNRIKARYDPDDMFNGPQSLPGAYVSTARPASLHSGYLSSMSESRRIEDYALLGDLQTAALVHRQGSIDWCCFPRFDSNAPFAALLGDAGNGRWLLTPADPVVQSTRRYRPGTLILETIHVTATGSVRVIDFMPPRGAAPDIVRIVEGLSGSVAMQSELIIRFEYGRIVPWVRRIDHARVAIAGPDALCFRTPAEIRGEGLTTVSEFTIEAGERVPFVLTWFPSHEALPAPVDTDIALADTEAFWEEWGGHDCHHGEDRDVIHESLVVLKALTYAPTGGIVAAPTTSLPEEIGGVRNWDYRYCWLRDASLTLIAMLGAGFGEEALAWREWLLRAVAGNPADIQIMYGVAGERRIEERELDWPPGFLDSRPVRVGNAASHQLQLDIYGEVLDAAYQTLRYGVTPSDDGWAMLRHMLDWLEDGWRQKDAGIWEVRGPRRHFTHSKVMAWVAFDRGVRICQEFGREGPVERWAALRDEIREQVLNRAWSDGKQAFAQSYGSDSLDASVLQMPLFGFIPATDPRFVSTVAAIRRELSVDGFLLRYRSEAGADGLPPGEGVFLACSFWLVEVLALQDKGDEARELFSRLLDLRNDIGLPSEEYDPVARRMLGNFPQAFTHLALVEAAITLSGDGPVRAPASPGDE